MANRLEMAVIQAILTLHERGWSNRRIALELGVHRETVARHLQRARQRPSCPEGGDEPGAKPANAPHGSGSKPAIAPTGLGVAPSIPSDATAPGDPKTAAAGRPSDCAPFRQIILEKLQLGLSARRIYQDLRDEHGFAGSYWSVRRYVRRHGRERSLPFRRLECSPGEEAQVDFGSGAPVITAEGKRRRTHVFRIVLSHSRKAYSEAVYRQTREDFIRVLENAFWHFGGVPRVVTIDNLRAAVNHPDWFDPELSPKLQSFCRHYGTVILPTKPRTPRHKGKVERGIGYVKDNALKGRSFPNLEAQNRHLLDWETRVADTRIHGTTRRQVGQVFEQVERPALQPLPIERFPFFHEAERSVHRDGHVEVAKAYYSVPPEYLGRTVWVRWDTRLVRIFNSRMEPIAVHVRSEPGRFRTLGEHLADEKISGVERGAAWLLGKIAHLGPRTEQWARAMLDARGIEGVRVLQGLISLAKRYPSDAIERACSIALSHRAFRLRTLRQLLKRPAARQETFDFLDEHPLIRPLSEYTVRFPLARDADDARQGFLRHGSGVQRAEKKRPPESAGPRRPDAPLAHPRPGYPSPGCSSAEPGSVSPDISNIVHDTPRSKEMLP